MLGPPGASPQNLAPPIANLLGAKLSANLTWLKSQRFAGCDQEKLSATSVEIYTIEKAKKLRKASCRQ